MFDHAFIMDLELCLACGKERPVIDQELCYECSRAMTYCITANNKVGHCPMCPTGDVADLYWSSYDTRDHERCLTHSMFVTRTIREKRRPDFAANGVTALVA